MFSITNCIPEKLPLSRQVTKPSGLQTPIVEKAAPPMSPPPQNGRSPAVPEGVPPEGPQTYPAAIKPPLTVPLPIVDTPLHLAAKSGDLATVKALLVAGADTTIKNNKGETPLHLAAMEGNRAVLNLLRIHGANLTIKNNNGQTPLDCARVSSWYTTEKHKQFVGGIFQRDPRIPALEKVPRNSTELEIIETLVLESAAGIYYVGMPINKAITDLGWKALHVAAEQGEVGIVKRLIDMKADVQSEDGDGNTPLHVAVKRGHTAVAEALLKAGANPKAANKSEETPLHFAVQWEHTDIVKALIAYEADVNATTDKGWTPLHEAAKSEKADLVQLLLNAGANPKAANKWVGPPLQLAVEREKLDNVKALLQAGADVNAIFTVDLWKGYTPLHGWTPLHGAIYNKDLATVKALIENGANVNAAVTDGPLTGWTPLLMAIQSGELDIVKAVLDAGANPDATRVNGATPLHVEVRFGHIEIAQLLIAAGADLNAKDGKRGGTPLHWAASSSKINDGVRLKTVATLIKERADVHAIANDGKTAQGWAKECRYTGVVKFLENAKKSLDAKDRRGNTELHRTAKAGELETVEALIAAGANTTIKNNKGKTPLQLTDNDAIKALLHQAGA